MKRITLPNGKSFTFTGMATITTSGVPIFARHQPLVVSGSGVSERDLAGESWAARLLIRAGLRSIRR